jgi:hypothetical protein
MALSQPGIYVGVCAPTYIHVRKTCFEDLQSGIVANARPGEITEINRNNLQITMRNGELWVDVLTSARRVFLGFGLAAVAVLMLTRTRAAPMAIGATFLLSVILTLFLRGGAAETAGYLFRLSVTTAFDLMVAVVVARVAFGPGEVTIHRIMGGVILYLSIGLIFASAYRAAAVLLNPSFTGLPANRRAALGELLYFSLSSLTTTGYGDIAPLHPFVRSLANLEAVIGQLFPATLLARLVTLHTAKDRSE